MNPHTVATLIPGYRAPEGCDVSDVDETTGKPSEAISAISASLGDELSTREVPHLTDEDLLATTRELEILSRRVAALQTATAAEIEARSKVPDLEHNLAVRHGCKSAIELLQGLTLSSRTRAARHLRLGRRLAFRQGFAGEVLESAYPVISAALAEGALSEEAASTILETVDRSKQRIPASECTVAERYLVAAATGGLTSEGILPDDGTAPSDDEGAGSAARGSLPENADEIRVRSRALLMYFDQDDRRPGIDEAMPQRGFRFGKERNGLIPVSGALLPETAALLARLFDSINSPRTTTNPAPKLTRNGPDESFDRFNADQYVPFDPARHGGTVRFTPVVADDSTDTAHPAQTTIQAHTASQETTVATEVDYVELHEADARSTDQKRHDALAVLLAIAAKHSETPLLGGAPVTVLIQTTEESLDPTARAGEAWLHDHDGSHSPIRLSAVRHAACSGGTQRITQAPNGRIIGIESPSRIFTPHQRRAIMLRDGGCIIPGCTVPTTWCEIHHVDEWAKGGKTTTDNGVLLCYHHHRTLESSGWQIRMRAGMPEVKPPRWVHGNRLWWRVHPATKPPDLRDVA